MKNIARLFSTAARYALFISLTTLGNLYSWSTPAQISNSGLDFNPNGSISVGGNAEIVWTQGTYPALTIFSSTYNGSWSAPASISSTGVNDFPKVAMDGSNNTVAVWIEVIAGNHLIRAATKPSGGAWSAYQTISSSLINYSPTVVMNASGDAIAGWINYSTNAVEVAHLTFGGAWSAPIVISASSSPKDNLNIVIDSTGNGVAVWQESDGADIISSNSTGLVWSAPVALNRNGMNENPAIYSGGVGQALAAWTNLEMLEVRTMWFLGGAWTFIPRVVSSDFVDNPAVATNALKGFIGWLNKLTGAIQVTEFIVGEWSFPPVNISTSSNNGPPSMSIDSTDTAIIAWSNMDTGSIDAVRFLHGGVPESPIAISSTGTNYSPSASSAGTASLVVWQSLVGSDWLVFANINP